MSPGMSVRSEFKGRPEKAHRRFRPLPLHALAGGLTNLFASSNYINDDCLVQLIEHLQKRHFFSIKYNKIYYLYL